MPGFIEPDGSSLKLYVSCAPNWIGGRYSNVDVDVNRRNEVGGFLKTGARERGQKRHWRERNFICIGSKTFMNRGQ